MHGWQAEGHVFQVCLPESGRLYRLPCTRADSHMPNDCQIAMCRTRHWLGAPPTSWSSGTRWWRP